MITLRYPVTPTKLGELELDATLRESHQRQADVTDHPVENGADITDHIRQKAAKYTFEGYITNTPLGGTADGARSQRAYTELELLVGRVVTVTTRYKVYENMTLETLDIPRDATTGEGLKFSGTFKQIKFVSSAVSTVALPSKKKLGPQAAQSLGLDAQKAALDRVNGIWKNKSVGVMKDALTDMGAL